MAAQKQDKQEEKVNSKTKCLITATGIFFWYNGRCAREG